MNIKIPFFDYPFLFLNDEIELLELIKNVSSRGAFIAQKELFDFETKLADYTTAKYSVGVGNATDGLELALRAGGIMSGDEVIICSHTMLATAVAVHFAGATPVPIDPGSDHLIDPEKIASAITDKTKAIFPTQLNGRTANMDAINEIANNYDLMIFEDAAQALGSKFKNQNAGTFGIASAISFYPAKTLGCLGDGGAVLTNNEEVYEKLIMLRDFGRNRDGEVGMWGRNSRLDNIQAAILSYRLDKYQTVLDRRRYIARIYQNNLSEITELSLPPGPDDTSDHYDIYQNYEIEAENRDKLSEYLIKKGIGTLVQWGGKAIHQYVNLGFNQKLPYTDQLFTRLLMLPMNMSISDDDVEYICDSIRKFYH